VSETRRFPEIPPPVDPGRCLVLGEWKASPDDGPRGVAGDAPVLDVIGHPLVAFAEVLRHLVADRMRPAFGLARSEPPTVLVTGDFPAEELAAFVAAIRRHAPEVGVWSLAGNAWRALSSPTDETAEAGWRIAGTPEEPASAPSRRRAPASVGAAPDPTAVTSEEIEMLLRLFDGDEPDGRGAGRPG